MPPSSHGSQRPPDGARHMSGRETSEHMHAHLFAQSPPSGGEHICVTGTVVVHVKTSTKRLRPHDRRRHEEQLDVVDKGAQAEDVLKHVEDPQRVQQLRHGEGSQRNQADGELPRHRARQPTNSPSRSVVDSEVLGGA